uniref:Uncharacterized protein n=1 Tax=Gossypium raimondii TaxID=29730 RepID=A0A0D2T789_GOSRA|nr:hypothetical protein B456_008G262300 [Gossypium raimondii]
MEKVEESASNVEEEVGQVLEQARELQESGASLLWRLSNEEQSLRQRANSLESSIRRLRSLITSLLSQKLLDLKLADKLEEDLERARCFVTDGDAAAFLPAKYQGEFLKTFLGPINVRASRKDVQLKVKEEYNSYRIYHHYCAIAMAVVSIAWEVKGQPNCTQKQRGVELFLQWAMMQGVAMLLQNRYQRQRLYTRIALGKNGCCLGRNGWCRWSIVGFMSSTFPYAGFRGICWSTIAQDSIFLGCS